MNIKSVGRNIIAVIVGFIIGSIVNMGLVNLGPLVVPLPDGADISTMDGLEASMELFTPFNFLFPFLGHALGTLVGAFASARLAGSHHMKMALFIGFLFLLGGITMVWMVGGPIWFNVTDLVFAYIPMGFLGGVLTEKTRS